MNKHISCLLILCLGLSPLMSNAQSGGAATAPAPQPVTVIRAGKFIDVERGRELSNQIIVIRGTKIEAVGPNLTVPEGAKVIDLSNMTVLPGLVDCHTHLADLAEVGAARCAEKNRGGNRLRRHP